MKKFQGPPLRSQRDSVDWDSWYVQLAQVLPTIQEFSVALNPSSVSATSTAEQDFTVTGISAGDKILSISKPTHTSGLGIVNYRVKDTNTVSITFMNVTGSPVDAGSETYTIIVLRG